MGIGGMVTIRGTSGDDTVDGTSGADDINVGQGGNDVVHAGAGDDTIEFGRTFTANDAVDGGAGNDVLSLKGNYTGAYAVVFVADTIANVETIVLSGGYSYTLTGNDGNVTSGQTLTVNGQALGATNRLTFDGSSETDGRFTFIGGAGNDVLTGGGRNDAFDLSFGGNDTAYGGDGKDTFSMGAALSAADRLDGGDGKDIVVLNGDYSAGVTLASSTLTNIETIRLTGGHNYRLVTNNATVSLGATLTVDGSALGTADTLNFTGTAETNGHFLLVGGAGNDNLVGGAQADIFDLSHGGTDFATGGSGDDLFELDAALAAGDHINGGPGNDVLVLDGAYSGLVLSASLFSDIETLVLAGGHNYSLTASDTIAVTGKTLTVDSSALNPTDRLSFNASAEMTSGYYFYTGQETDTLTGGRGDDTFDLQGNLTAADKLDGRLGTNTLSLNGDYSAGVVFGSATIRHIQQIQLSAGYSYALTTADANLAAGQVLTVDGTPLGPGDALAFNGAAETDGKFQIYAGAGANILTGGALNDSFIFQNGFSAADRIDGGAGPFDTVQVAAGCDVVFTPETVQNVEILQFGAGASYAVTAATGDSFIVDAMSLLPGDSIMFDGSAGTAFTISDGAGIGTFQGGTGADHVSLAGQGDSLSSNDGDDIVSVHEYDLVTDTIDGGGGTDTLNLNGYGNGSGAAATLTGTAFTNMEIVNLANAVNAIEADGNVAAGAILTVNAFGDETFDGSAETDGSFEFHITGSTVYLAGGAQNDVFHATGGDLHANGGGGADIFDLNGGATVTATLQYGAASESSSTQYDTLENFSFSNVKFDLSAGVNAIDPAVTTGDLSAATFDADLSSDIGSAQLAAGDAVLFTPDGGDLAGQDFLLVDMDGQPGYEAGGDLVIHLVNASGTLTLSNFT